MTYESVASHRPSDVSRLDRACVVTSRCAFSRLAVGAVFVRVAGGKQASY